MALCKKILIFCMYGVLGGLLCTTVLPAGTQAAEPVPATRSAEPISDAGVPGDVNGEARGPAVDSLFSGGSRSGLGVLDIALLLVAAFFIMRFVAGRGKRRGTRTIDAGARRDVRDLTPPTTPREEDRTFTRDRDDAPQSGPGLPPAPPVRPTVKQQAASAWAHLSSTPSRAQAEDTPVGIPLPDGFDAAEFLDGARTLYTRLQTDWAARDMDAIRPFVTPRMLTLLEERAARDPQGRELAVLQVNAVLEALEPTAGEERASVRYTALLQESGAASPSEVRENWEFVRSLRDGGTWRLDAIA